MSASSESRKRLPKGTPGKAAPSKKVEYVGELLDERQRKENSSELSYSTIAHLAGLGSKSTVCRWNHRDMSAEAQATRLEKRGHNRLLSPELEAICAGYLMERCLTHQTTTTDVLRAFVQNISGQLPLRPWVTRFQERQHFSLRVPQGESATVELEEAVQAGVRFHQRVLALDLKDSQIAAFDKTGLYNNAQFQKELAPKGR